MRLYAHVLRIVGRGTFAFAVLGGFVLLAAHTALARKAPLGKIEYRTWVDGKKYSMATWRHFEDVKLAISRYLDRKYGPLTGKGAQRLERLSRAGFVDAQVDLDGLTRFVTEQAK